MLASRRYGYDQAGQLAEIQDSLRLA